MLGLGVAIGCVSKIFNSTQAEGNSSTFLLYNFLRISSSVRPIVNYVMCTSGFDPDLETGPDVIMMMVCQYFRETNRSTYKLLFIKSGNTFEDFNGRSK